MVPGFLLHDCTKLFSSGVMIIMIAHYVTLHRNISAIAKLVSAPIRARELANAAGWLISLAVLTENMKVYSPLQSLC